jgi:membrane protease YdiL (CAAX protease family)
MARARPWLSLVIGPLVLAVCFAGAAAVLIASNAATPDTVGAALQGQPVIPATLAFLLSFVIVRAFATRDGLSLSALGWAAPTPATALFGVIGALLFAAINTFVLFPLVHGADPTFDAELSTLSLTGAMAMLGAGVLFEETTFRGYALLTLKERIGVPGAVLVTSLAYGLLAPGPTWPPKLWAVGFGVLAAAIRLWRGSLWPVVLIHLAAALAPKLLAAGR